MADIPVTSDTGAPRWGARTLLLALFPLLLLGALLGFLVVSGSGLGARTAPPIEELTIDRVSLPASNQIVIEVTNGGPDSVTVSQVIVDDAYWQFAMTPDTTIPRLGRATITTNYPWVQDEQHAILIMTDTGLTFASTVEVATLAPAPTAATFWQYALLGIYVGFIPVGLGLMWYPFLRRLGRTGMQAVLALTVGLLLFLLFDTIDSALGIIATTAPAFGGAPLVFLVALLTFGALIALGINQLAESIG